MERLSISSIKPMPNSGIASRSPATIVIRKIDRTMKAVKINFAKAPVL